ncbi:MAG TPA: hypothetical protein VJ865_05750, partial [Gemmatimonadaceae bacterium]|nr:hypothetical protein [Gemmatimonadaceae bacterium]
MLTNARALTLLGIGAVACHAEPARATPCDSVAKLNLANTKIVAAQTVSAGTFRPPTGRRRQSVEIFNGFDRL